MSDARDLLIFDLDGTLIDSKQDLVNSVNATLAARGRLPLADDQVAAYVGNGAPMLVKRALEAAGSIATEAELAESLQFFLDYYRAHMLDYTVLYPGVREALDRLRQAGVALAVLTNKPVKFSVSLVEGLGLENHFFRVYGGNSFEEKKPHPVGIQRLMEESRISPAGTIMVGDSAVDVLTARAANVRACGVSWGFQPHTFAEVQPDFVIDDMRTLAEIVLDRDLSLF